MKIYRHMLSLIAVAALAAGCGGGSGGEAPLGGDDAPPPTGGISRSGIASGPIAGIGSVIVNGVRYDTSNASFTVDDAPGTEADLAVGNIVTVKGEIDDDGLEGTADEVILDDDLQGPVQSIDLAAETLIVLGQTVLVDATTSFDDDFSPASLEGIAVGDFVEVSGFFTADGSIRATSIEREDDTDEFEVHGFVADLDDVARTFRLGMLTVDYSGASLDDFPNGMISDGDFVEAEGDSLGSSGELIADEVELEDRGIDGDDGDRVEIEGLITRFVSPEDFDVNGTPVTTTAATEFEDGSAADLALDRRVEVEGELDADGVIVAEEIDFRNDDDVRIEAVVDAVDSAAGTVVLLGITVRVDELTRFDDQSDDDLRQFGLDDINVGDFLEVRGTEEPPGSREVLASLIEREDDDENGTELRGFVESIAEPSFVILGVTVETDAATEFDDGAGSAAEFFSRLRVGSLVEADGTEIADQTLLAEEVEFEDDDDT